MFAVRKKKLTVVDAFSCPVKFWSGNASVPPCRKLEAAEKLSWKFDR